MPVGLKLSHNGPEVVDAVQEWAQAIVEVAAPRAANALRDQAKTVGLREIARIYGIPVRRFEKYVEIGVAIRGDPTAYMRVKGRGLPLMLFKPRVIRGRGGGVQFTVKGRTHFIPTAFIARIKNASPRDPEAQEKKGVFARGAYGGKGKQEYTGRRFGKFQFGRRRLVINELFTFSRADAFANDDVQRVMEDRLKEQTSKVLSAQIRFATR
jgi:hypothetical protein